MNDKAPETTELTQLSAELAPSPESAVFGVSVRGWVTLLIVGTVCGMSAWGIMVDEPLKAGFIFCIGFYFGQKLK